MGLILRRFGNEDEAKKIVRLFNACFEAHRTLEEWKWIYLQTPGFDPSGILVAEDQDTREIVGSLVVVETNVSVNGRKRVVGMINDVDTLPPWRGRGIATKLMMMAIEECKRKGRSALFLYVNPYGEAARIYRRIGFRDIHHFYVHAKTGGLRLAARNTPFPMNLATPVMALVSAVTSKRCKSIKSPAKTHQVDCSDDRQCEAYLETLNDSLRSMPLFYPYLRDQLNWMIRDAPKSVALVARFIEKNGRIVCGGNASIFRMKFFGRTFNSWVIGDLFTSGNLQSPEKEAYVRSLVEDLVQMVRKETVRCTWLSPASLMRG